ncbi:cytokine receptor family member b1 [Lampris incognitus]|uniref:cytokine receptor family member b1 n=1 Tax=Lampris incognitus TaxID=2546036 RepID=UPI0024B4AAC4|nr:cytokine receptor family member b1 [Lampris incognitus]
MNALLTVLYLMIELSKEVSPPPAPVNLYVDSHNFHHVLSWDPGPGTPPGTQYIVFSKVNKKKRQMHNPANTTTSCKLKLRIHMKYHLSVQAYHNQSLSPESDPVFFTPFKDTKIQAPTVSLSGCGNCLLVKVLLPKTDKSSQVDILQVYNALIRISWKKAREEKAMFKDTSNTTFTLDYLETGIEYCVQVHIMIHLNKNTMPSNWMCEFTSAPEPNKVPAVGGVAATLIIVGGTLIALTMSLAYTGVLCKLKTHVPRILLNAVVHGYVLRPERTIPDLVSISSEPDEQRRIPAHRPIPHSTEGPTSKQEEDDEEEEEEDKETLYWDRADRSSSRDTSGLSAPAVPGVSGSSTVRSSAEVEQVVLATGLPPRGCSQAETEGERVKLSFMPNEDQPVTGEVDEDEQGREVMEEENSSNVNLLSVTLGSPWRESEEDEEEGQSNKSSMSDFFKLPEQQPLLSTSLQRTLSSTKQQSETQPSDQTLLVSMQETGCESRPQDNTDTFPGYLVACTVGTQPEQSEEDEEEEFSGYMGR